MLIKLDDPVSTSRVKVNILDCIANDGQGLGDQAQFSDLQARGAPRDYTSSQRKVEWTSTNGRNYGMLKLMDIPRSWYLAEMGKYTQ